MKMMLSILLLAALTAEGQRTATATATLRLIPESTLPGIPVSFLITILNPNDRVLTLEGMTLQATNGDGTFDVVSYSKEKVVSLPDEGTEDCGGVACLKVPANGQRELLVDVGPLLAGNEFFHDSRIMKPGTYDLQATVYEFGKWLDGAIRTNSARLTVREPAGVDLEVWKFMNEVSAPYDWSLASWAMIYPRFAEEIQSRYPTSAYVPSVVSFGAISAFAGDVSAFDHALAMSPPLTVRDNLLWHKADYLSQLSERTVRIDRDIERAVAFADSSRETFQELQRVAISELMRQRAAKGLSHLYTRSLALQEISYYERTDPPAPKSVIPRVECVTRGSDKTFTAQFGYENPNEEYKMIQLGNLNQITPAPRDQRQPRMFRAGVHTNVFTGSSSGGNLTWHLDGQKATATRDFAVQCQQTAATTH